MLTSLYVARPKGDCDYIYLIVKETLTYYISNTGKKFPKKIVDTFKPWHENYYFSSQDNIERLYSRLELIERFNLKEDLK